MCKWFEGVMQDLVRWIAVKARPGKVSTVYIDVDNLPWNYSQLHLLESLSGRKSGARNRIPRASDQRQLCS